MTQTPEGPDLSQVHLPPDARARLASMRGDGKRGMFTSDLSVNEFLLVREAGFRPVGLVLGSSVYHVGIQVGRWSKNMELDKLTQAMYHARELAMTRMEAEAAELGADGIVGVRLEIEFKEYGNDLAEFIAIGTAVVADAPPPNGAWRNVHGLPFTSDLSGQDFWTLIQAGYAPQGLVMGTCVYHIAHRGILTSLATIGANVEIEQYTEALYDARELAMSRMQAEGEALGAEGIVGVQMLSLPHRWGGHTTEFFAIGTAVRPLREDHVIATPTLVLPLTDGDR
ncbi:MAG: heavy metal-binding domain-containing protein [Janthinobacterium lividum]